MARTRTVLLGPASRPVAAPDDADGPGLVKASGQVTLPHHVRWSGPPLQYDLADPIDRARVYEQVLQEGTDDDVRYFVDVDELLAMWDDIVLPTWVRKAWARWFKRHRGVDVSC